MPQPAISTSPGLQDEKDKQNIKQYTPNAEQQATYAYYIERFNKAKEQRGQKRREFDNLDYETDYQGNKDAANAYLTPKMNDDEVRIVTGLTEKKIDVVYNELIGMNLQPEINCFDHEDNEYKDLGTDIGDIVKRTNEIERDDDVWKSFVREMLTQRAAFIEEVDDYEVISNRGKLWMNEKGGTTENITTSPVIIHRAKKKFISGLQVYLGDINIPAYLFQKQPYIFKYYRKTYAEAKTTYQLWPQWEFVAPGMPSADAPYNYRLNAIEKDEIEEIHYLDPVNDEYMIMINGVLMLDEPKPLPYIVTSDRKYNMTMTVLKEVSNDFAYGKPLTASAKTLQGLSNEIIRLLIRKFRQAIEPPLAVANAGKVYSKDIWTAGAVSYGIKATDFSVLNPSNQGVTSSEFNIYNLIEQKTEEFIGTPNIAQGMDAKGAQTATEVLNQQKNFIKQLGLSVLAVMVAKRDNTYLRVYNLLENFTSPIGKRVDPITQEITDIYSKWTVSNGTFNNGKKGKKVIQFMDRDITDEETKNMYEWEKDQENMGKPTRIRVINVKDLMEIPMFFYVTVTQKERDGSALNKVMFADKMNQAAGISKLTGTPLNSDALIEEFEYTWQVKNFFQRQPQQGMAGEGQGADPEMKGQVNELMGEIDKLGQSKTTDQMKEGEVAGQTNQPSLNTMEGQYA